MIFLKIQTFQITDRIILRLKTLQYCPCLSVL